MATSLECSISSASHQSMSFFFFNDTATTEIYTLSLHDALPICRSGIEVAYYNRCALCSEHFSSSRSEEHTSELQSQSNLVCRLLLEKKKQNLRDSTFLGALAHLFRLTVVMLC